LSTASGGAGDNVHCNVLPPLAPWRGTSPLDTGISYQQRSTTLSALQPSLSTTKQIYSVFLWWKNDMLPIPFPKNRIMQKTIQRNGNIAFLFPIYIFPLNVCHE
jgi:hypothetical protein